MTTLYQDIRGALQSQLATVTGIPALAYEGFPYKPVRGTPYCDCVLVPTSGRPYTLGTAHLIDHEGTFEVGVTYPSGVGTGTAEAMADAIKAKFTAATTITQGTTIVRIRSSERRQALVDTDWIRIPVSVRWYLFSQTY